MRRIGLAWAGVNGCLAVAAGAYASHGLADPRAVDLVRMASSYGLWHALALIAAVLLADRWPGRAVAAAGWLFALGLPLFCGSLYLTAAYGSNPLGPLAPVGGTAFMAGWLALALAAWRRP